MSTLRVNKQSTVEIVRTKVRQNKANNYSNKQRENIWLFIIVKKNPKVCNVNAQNAVGLIEKRWVCSSLQ